jgi:hypothetical protein
MLRLLCCEAPRYSAAAVMADDGEPFEAERAHDLDLIEHHRTFRVATVVLAVRWFATEAVAAKIGATT